MNRSYQRSAAAILVLSLAIIACASFPRLATPVPTQTQGPQGTQPPASQLPAGELPAGPKIVTGKVTYTNPFFTGESLSRRSSWRMKVVLSHVTGNM